ncbi:hypothetical protein [Actinocorallia libanotica]|uniref:Uncharacterized protein n=1 Tax=Actinocorallia libanotica TaxID=46162 RepID=A0ABP4AHE5_9ACTN
MTDQPLVQFSTPIRATDEYQVVVRPTTLAEVDLAKAILAKALLELAGPVKALAQGLKEAPATAVELLQQELGAVVIAEVPAPQATAPAPMPTPEQQLAQGQWPNQFGQPPVQAQPHYHQAPGPDMVPAPAPQWAGQPQAQGYVHQAPAQAPAYPQAQGAAPAAPAPAATGDTGNCWACGKNRICPDCGGPTVHKVVESRAGKKLNVHDCMKGQRHKGVWCRTPIFRSAQAAYTQQTGQQPPVGLVYEQ